MNLSEENLKIDRETMERTNPIFNTAKSTTYEIAMSGDPDALKLVEALGMTRKATQGTSKDQLEVVLANDLQMETRYRTMMAMALGSGCKTEVDLPCGYTPRAIQVTREGMRFVGLDLPATIEEAEKPILGLVDPDKKGFAKLAPADATNYASVRAALENVEGPVCVTTEGLMMYLADSELEALCNNIRRVLEEFGGCWITPDPECGLQFFATFHLLAGPRTMELLKLNYRVFSQKSDVELGKNFLIIDVQNPQASIGKAKERLAALGFRVERIPIAKYMPTLRLYDKLTPEQVESYKNLMENICYWKLTLADTDSKAQWTDEAQDVRIDAGLENGLLRLSLSGRLDSLSAPRLLALYERARETWAVEEIRVDCGNLSYISSAGLRILLMMAKAYPDRMALQNVGQTVMDIFETTGFADILNIEQ